MKKLSLKNLVAAITLALPFVLPNTALAASNVDVSQIRSLPAGIHGMAVADNGDLYYSDSFGNASTTRRVYKLAAPYTGTAQATPITGALPAGLLWDNNTLYVADTSNNTIRQFDNNYNLLNTWTVNAPWLMQKADNGALLITSYNNQVFRLNTNGSVDLVLNNLAAPFGLAVTDNNTLWVSEQGSGAGMPGYLKRWDLNGNLQQEVQHTWDNPEGLQIDNEGSLWIADTGAGEILRLDDLGILDVISTGLSYPIIITTMPDGDLLFNTSGGAAGLYKIDFEQAGGNTSEVLLNQQNLSANRRATLNYSFNVPVGKSLLTINQAGGTGDADLYVRYGSTPTTASYDCRPYLNGNNETCSFNNPTAGAWYVQSRAYRAFSGVSLTATVE